MQYVYIYIDNYACPSVKSSALLIMFVVDFVWQPILYSLPTKVFGDIQYDGALKTASSFRIQIR